MSDEEIRELYCLHLRTGVDLDVDEAGNEVQRPVYAQGCLELEAATCTSDDYQMLPIRQARVCEVHKRTALILGAEDHANFMKGLEALEAKRKAAARAREEFAQLSERVTEEKGK